MARKRSSAASRRVQAGEVKFTSRDPWSLPRVAALSSLHDEQEYISFQRHQDFVAGAVARRLPVFPPAKPLLPLRSRGVWSALRMLSPRRVLFCLRRRIRREVIFAVRKNGRNGGRVYRRRVDSQYSC